jgi:PAS domain-containing protein
MVLVLDEQACVHDLNLAAARTLGAERDVLLRKLCGEVLRCAHATGKSDPCGTMPPCKECVVRDTIRAAMQGQRVLRRKARFEVLWHGKPETRHLLVTGSPFEHANARFALIILEDVTELAELRSILPICANCKKIRDDSEYWEHVEEYLRRHLDVELSHSFCPECSKKLYPDLFK